MLRVITQLEAANLVTAATVEDGPGWPRRPKSSVVERALFLPNLQGLAPIMVRVWLDPDVIESPSRFLDH